jgi:hypothetical protein
MAPGGIIMPPGKPGALPWINPMNWPMACKPVKPPKNPRPDGTPVSKYSRGYMDAPFVYALLDYTVAQEVWVDMH